MDKMALYGMPGAWLRFLLSRCMLLSLGIKIDCIGMSNILIAVLCN